MERLCRIIEGLSRGGAFVSAFFMLAIVALILVEIVVRATLGASTLIASEYSGYFLVALVVFGFGHTFHDKAFIRIGLLLAHLPHGARRALDVLMALGALGITLYVLAYSVDMAWESWQLDMRADTMSETPFWMPQLVAPLGLALLALQLCAFIARRAGGLDAPPAPDESDGPADEEGA
ncbi:MAG: TRAP transporter small permease subunit [Desulfovibrionaceae bacterium]